MGTIFELKYLDLSNLYIMTLPKSKFEETDLLPFMSSTIPLITFVALYLLFVLKIGPQFMKNRKPYNLKYTLIIYNTVQVALSTFLFYRYAKFVLNTGLVYSSCHMNDPEIRQLTLWNIWLYLGVKAVELLDTVFFVLRKKTDQMSFLHIYHHSLMLTITWLFLKYEASELFTFPAALNSLVHIIMYAYYALAAFGPQMTPYLKWKRHLTSLQLIQFMVCFIVYLGNQICNECPINIFFSFLIFFNYFVFLYLFGKFYYDNYLKMKWGNAKMDLNKNK